MSCVFFLFHLLLLHPCDGSKLKVRKEDTQDDTANSVSLLQATVSLQQRSTRHKSEDVVALLKGMTKDIYNIIMKKRDSMTRIPVKDYGHPDWLPKCEKIYLDVGTNIGVQIRKFFEPSLYFNATVLPLFEKKFGPPSKRCVPGSESGLCVLGFEPNPRLQPRLQALEQAYTARGWHVHIYPVAVSGADGELSFEAPRWGGPQTGWGTDWGAHSVPQSRVNNGFWESLTDQVMDRSFPVRAINFPEFLKTLPAEASIPLMKMDIEGGEWATLASMEDSGMLCKEVIEEAFIETHPGGDATTWKDDTTMDAVNRRMQRQKKCAKGPIIMDAIDDESYFLDVNDCFKDANFCKEGFGKSSSCSSH